MRTYTYDVIVIGGGHAGIEAAHAAAKMGSKTALVTLKKDTIGRMPCNPALGGVGKGHIVYEISALGGLMPQLATESYLQARMLNTRKGPAVQGLRLQIDKYKYSTLSQKKLQSIDNITIIETAAENIILNEQKNVTGIKTANGKIINAPSVIITTGTFLKGTLHVGEQQTSGGRQGEQAVSGLSNFLKKTGLKLGRLKTGTPPRLLKSSLDYNVMERQGSDNLTYLFEFYQHTVTHKHDCFITKTNEKTHKIIKNNLHKSAMYNGNISGIGPRYCPSIEDKIGRFPDKLSHNIFVEPEGANANEVYPNGISTSLPIDVQEQYIQSIDGFEDAIITKPGYAVEYDFVHPSQLNHTLQIKNIPGLFLAGQINGTTGYEEAAGQGIIAGINAHLYTHNKKPFILNRQESYIGVMIDDLVIMGVDEPYRMFTSRAERRLILRQDNTFLRLTDYAYNFGLINQNIYNDFCTERDAINYTLQTLREKNSDATLISKYGQSLDDIKKIKRDINFKFSDRALLNIHAEIRYTPYIAREKAQVERAQKMQKLHIPQNFNFTDLPGLSNELQQKMQKYKPSTIADAALIPGMTPAAISLLIFKVKQR